MHILKSKLFRSFVFLALAVALVAGSFGLAPAKPAYAGTAKQLELMANCVGNGTLVYYVKLTGKDQNGAQKTWQMYSIPARASLVTTGWRWTSGNFTISYQFQKVNGSYLPTKNWSGNINVQSPFDTMTVYLPC